MEMERVYISFRVSGETGATPGDPAKFWANPTTTGSMIKNTITILLAIISDFIIVSLIDFLFPKACLYQLTGIGLADVRYMATKYPRHPRTCCASVG